MNEDTTPYGATQYRRPGRPGIVQIDVDRAADALMRNGERPSIEKVRAAIGGSPNRLGPLLDDWWRRLAARMEVGPGAFERLPGSLAQIAEAFFLHALEEARKAARNEEKQRRDALAQAEDDLEVRSHVLSLRERELQQRLDEREATVTTMLAQIRSQALRIRKLEAAQKAADAPDRARQEAPRRSAAKQRRVAAAKRATAARNPTRSTKRNRARR